MCEKRECEWRVGRVFKLVGGPQVREDGLEWRTMCVSTAATLAQFPTHPLPVANKSREQKTSMPQVLLRSVSFFFL